MQSFLSDLVLAARLVDRYFEVYKAHAVEHLGSNKIILHLGYPFVNYDFADADASIHFNESFNEHVQLQEEHYLVDHERSKHHGKLKGKHLRLALNFQNIMNVFTAGMTVEGWNRNVSSTCLKAALLVGAYQDEVSKFFAKFAKEHSQRSVDPPKGASRGLPRPEVLGTSKSTSNNASGFLTRFENVLTVNAQDFFASTPEPIRVIVRSFALKILAMRVAWLDSTKLRSQAYLRDFEPEDEGKREQVVVYAMVFLKHFQFGFYGLSTNTVGKKKLFFYKRREPVLLADAFVFGDALAQLNMDHTLFYAPTESVLKEQSKDQTNPPVLNLPLPAYQREAVHALFPYLQTWGVPPTIELS